MSNEDKLIRDSIFKIGKVVSVDGRTVRISVDKTKNSSHLFYKGELVKNVSVGSYLKIIKGFTKIIGKVEGEYTIEDKYFKDKDYKSYKDKVKRELNLSLLGFFSFKGFERGIKEMPLIDNECYLLDKDEFDSVHDFVDKKSDKPISIGKLTLEKGLSINLGINSLFASHIGIFGNTGSGKSYTLAKIYRELFKSYKDEENFKVKAKFFLLDFNGEYVKNGTDNIIVEEKYKTIYKLSTRNDEGDKYPVSNDTIKDTTFWTIILEATEKTQTPFLRRAINNNYLEDRIKDLSTFKDLFISQILLAIDKNDKELGLQMIVDFMTEISKYLESSNILKIRDILREKVQYNNKYNQFYFINEDKSSTHEQNELRNKIESELMKIEFSNFKFTQIEKLKLKILIQYYDDILRGFANREHLAPLIKRMEKRFDDLKKVIEVRDEVITRTNITVVSLKNVNIHMRKILPLLFCKQLYDEQKNKNDNTTYLNLIIDEAHNILSRMSERESEQWKDYRLETFEEIIKEGRKFGVFLTLASQRPSDISATILSQLHNFFLHRLINNNDIMAIEKSISYLDKLSFEYLPILPTGTCILAGLVAQVPVIIDIGTIEDGFEPENKTINLIKNWEQNS